MLKPKEEKKVIPQDDDDLDKEVETSDEFSGGEDEEFTDDEDGEIEHTDE